MDKTTARLSEGSSKDLNDDVADLLPENVAVNSDFAFLAQPTTIHDTHTTNNVGSESDEDTESERDSNDALERMFSNTSADNKEKPSLVPNESRFNGVEYLINSLHSALDSVEFDKALVTQSKMAGAIHNSSSDVMKCINDMECALKDHLQKYTKLKTEILPQIEANLAKITSTTDKLTKHMKQKHPLEYSKGRSKVLENLVEDEEGLYL